MVRLEPALRPELAGDTRPLLSGTIDLTEVVRDREDEMEPEDEEEVSKGL